MPSRASRRTAPGEAACFRSYACVSATRFTRAASIRHRRQEPAQREPSRMDRNAVIRWIVIAAVMLVFWKWGLPLITGKSDKVQSVRTEAYVDAPGFVPDKIDPTTPDHPGPWDPKEGEICKIKGKRFDAELSTRGA